MQMLYTIAVNFNQSLLSPYHFSIYCLFLTKKGER